MIVDAAVGTDRLRQGSGKAAEALRAAAVVPALRNTAATKVPALRTVRIGLLGLGQVGQAVARLASDRASASGAGCRFQIEQALVRDVDKARRCVRPARLTNNPSAFLRGRYDVVVEALDAVEPARTLVARLLGRGTSVVTCNKALVAAHGSHLTAIACARGAVFRYEACALAAVPFLGTLAERPLVSSVDRLLAIVNGTCNDVLTTLAEPGATFDAALQRARDRGYAESDASRDLDGADAADKLTLLASLFGWGALALHALEVTGIRGVTADDLAAARRVGGTLKPVVFAARDASGVRAFVGPALVPLSEPLAALGGALNGIRLDGKYVSNLFFSGPGAGPDVTAATLLDDAVQAVSVARRSPRPPASTDSRPVAPHAPATPWFVRVTLPGVVPGDAAVASLAAATGVAVERIVEGSTGPSRWLLVGPLTRTAIDAAAAELSTRHRIETAAYRRIASE